MGLLDLDGGTNIQKLMAYIQGSVGSVSLTFHFENLKTAELHVAVHGPKGKCTGALLTRAAVATLRKHLEEAETLFQEAEEAKAEKRRLERELTSEIDRITEPKKEG
jgi:hypothetical protein